MTKRIFEFEHVVWSNSRGITVSRSGGRYLQMAKKLVRAGTAELTEVSSRYAGPGQSYETGTNVTVYRVTELI